VCVLLRIAEWSARLDSVRRPCWVCPGHHAISCLSDTFSTAGSNGHPHGPDPPRDQGPVSRFVPAGDGPVCRRQPQHACSARGRPGRGAEPGESTGGPQVAQYAGVLALRADLRAESQVRRARFGPGLWPGPRRQARRVGRGLRCSRAGPKIVSAEWLETILGALDAGGADPDNARRSGLVPVTFPAACAPGARTTAWSYSCGAAPGRYGGDRLRAGGGAAVRGSRRARRAAARKGASEAAAQQRRVPR